MTEPSHGPETIADRHGFSLDAVRHLVRALEAGTGPDGAVQPSRARRLRAMVGRRHDHDRRHVQHRPQGPGRRALHPPSPRRFPPAAGRPDPGAGTRSGPPPGARPPRPDRRTARATRTFRPIAASRSRPGGGSPSTTRASTRSAAWRSSRAQARICGSPGPAAPWISRRSSGWTTRSPSVPAPETRPFEPEPFGAGPSSSPAPAGPAGPAGDVLTTLERLAELQRKGVLTEAEFAAKKAELLARL